MGYARAGSTMMLHHYLDDIRRRLWMRFAARVSLGLVVGAALVTGLFAVAFVALVPDAGVVDAPPRFS
jgi:hypothetical protein